MKQLVALILFIGLNAQCLIKLGTVTWYTLNKEYVTEKFCINKAKPKMHCNGKCYLKKQLAKSGDETNNSEKQRLPEKTDTIYISAIIPPVLRLDLSSPDDILIRYGRHLVTIYEDYYSTIFHPPPGMFDIA